MSHIMLQRHLELFITFYKQTIQGDSQCPGTDSLYPTLGHRESLLIFQENLSHRNSFQGSKTKCSLFTHNNHIIHVLTTKWITTLQITRSNKQNNFFIHCAPTPPVILFLLISFCLENWQIAFENILSHSLKVSFRYLK